MDNTTARKRILIVDDEIDFTYVMRLTLEGTGQYQVRTLNTATQVVSVARDFRPHLILLDCMMPGQDGGEVAAAIQKDPVLKDTPFAFFTATVTEPETVTSRCYEGPQEYLPKTIRMEELVSYIERKTGGAEGRAEAGAPAAAPHDQPLHAAVPPA
jgi:CheY-like chemotaxis protein